VVIAGSPTGATARERSAATECPPLRLFTTSQPPFWHYVRMSDERSLTLRQTDQARGDLYAIADELEVVKMQLSQLGPMADPRLPLRTVLMATASIWGSWSVRLRCC
jgi:hypothetical protein